MTMHYHIILISYMICHVLQADFKLGIENISPAFLKTIAHTHNHASRIGLIAHHASKDQQGRRTLDLLLSHGLQVSCVFVPEHGFDGTVQAGYTIENGKDLVTGISVISLYAQGKTKMVDASIMQSLDVLIFDLQDVGMRHYTYLATLYEALEAAAQHNLLFVLLDRPNPLGSLMEGPVISDFTLQSSIARLPIPLRYGMTIGELATYCNKYVLKNPARLHIVKMREYQRQVDLPRTVVSNVSPHISSYKACHGYSFLGLLGEVRPFDVGLGTSHSFSCIALPKQYSLSAHAWRSFQNMLLRAGVQSLRWSYVSQRTKKSYDGVRLHIPDITQVHSCWLLIDILSFFKKAGISLTFSSYFDRAAGTDIIRRCVLGDFNRLTAHRLIAEQTAQFFKQASSAFLYKPIPHLAHYSNE
jgi:uncharacterized protein YbbC (DUF1343 family)